MCLHFGEHNFGKKEFVRSGEDRRFVEKKVQGSGRTMDEFEGRQEEHLVA